MALTQHEIRAAIRELQLSHRPVCLHASLRSFGHVEGGAHTVVQTFIDEGCTLCVPTFSYGFAVPAPPEARFPRNGWDYAAYAGPTSGMDKVYTPASTEIAPDMGAIPAAVLAHPEHVRGDHPLCSFSAVGPAASNLITPQRPDDVYAPLQELCRQNGFVLLAGVGLDRLTLLHMAEKEAGRRLFRRWANDAGGRPMVMEVGGCSDGFPRLEAALQPVSQTTIVGQSVWRLLLAQAALIRAAAAIRANPEITHCDDPVCERCNDAIAGGPIL